MKKKFKAPIVEAKELNAANSIMADGSMLISANGVNGGKTFVIDTTLTDYNQWKSNR